MPKKFALWVQLIVDFILLTWFVFIYSIDSIDSINLIDSTNFIDFINFTDLFIFMKISQTINAIIYYVYFIIKTRQRNFTSSNCMQLPLNSFHFMPKNIFMKQNIKIFFMSYVFNNILLAPFAFLIFSLSTVTREYVFDFNPTNSLIIFPLTSSFTTPITWQDQKILNLLKFLMFINIICFNFIN